ncbi:hypothetical protein DKE44_001470 [Acinetobacter nosocomialis]|nr:hypothetical protein DKC18_001445 [Acinetobacter nosocomialis]AZC03850.1 hypothetical protein DKE50_001485 [Acinetobacter nosocomialis]AZC05549.1 hypothetical protein DKE44_001470 [Acinetobacter nosocomialis]
MDSVYIFIQICGANHVIRHEGFSMKDTQLTQFNSESSSQCQQTVTEQEMELQKDDHVLTI